MSQKPALIAIIDDDESVRESTKGLMRSVGFSAETFSSAEEFLHSPNFDRTACLVADVNMPGMSGLDLYCRVSALGKALPTILITAYPSETFRVRALTADVVCYLSKPFSEDDLLRCIRSALDERSQHDGGA